MAGTIIADTLTHSTAGSVTTDYVVNGSAKAWVNFNGTGTVAIRDNLNLTSLTDNGTGDYTLGFVSSMGNANYSHAGSSGGQSSTSNGAVYAYDQATARTSGLFRVLAFTTGGSAVDVPNVDIHVMGDLA